MADSERNSPIAQQLTGSHGLFLGKRYGIRIWLAWNYCLAGMTLLGFAFAWRGSQGNADLPIVAALTWIAIGLVGVFQDAARCLVASALGGKDCGVGSCKESLGCVILGHGRETDAYCDSDGCSAGTCDPVITDSLT